MFPIVKKADIILVISLMVLGIFTSFKTLSDNPEGEELVITVNGEKFGAYPLSEDRRVTIKEDDHLNKVIIKEGRVSMDFSDCPGKDCVRSAPISKAGEVTVCLPNRVVLSIEGNADKDGYDAVSR